MNRKRLNIWRMKSGSQIAFQVGINGRLDRPFTRSDRERVARTGVRSPHLTRVFNCDSFMSLTIEDGIRQRLSMAQLIYSTTPSQSQARKISQAKSSLSANRRQPHLCRHSTEGDFLPRTGRAHPYRTWAPLRLNHSRPKALNRTSTKTRVNNETSTIDLLIRKMK